MNIQSITIPVKLNTELFRRFAIFDTLKRQKRWKSPAIFAGILLAFALICFAMNNRAEQAVFLGSVLMIIALGLPAVYFGMFFRSLNTQAKALNLDAKRLVYTVELTSAENGVMVASALGEKQSVEFHWKDLYAAYRVEGCIYFYVSDRQAFLLPDDQASVETNDLWDYLKDRMDSSKIHDCRKK